MIPVEKVISALQHEFGSFYSSNKVHNTNDFIRYINSWVNLICTSKNFDFNKYSYQFSTDNNNTKYNIPFQIETFFIQNESWKNMNLYTFEDYYRLSDKTNAFMINSEDLVTENKWTYNIFYRWVPDSVTNANDTIEIPAFLYDLLVVAASYYWFLDEKAYSLATTKKSIYDWMISSYATRLWNPLPINIKRINKPKSAIF